MSERHNNTAILVFSRSAQAESREKKLAFDARKAVPVAQLMIDQTRKIVQSTELPYFFFTEKQQVGSNFGERMANAFDAVFAKGFTNVIAIGNDCLTLSKTDILDAAHALNTGTDAVLGKTSDGGAYLIGLQKTTFDALDFQKIAWQTPSVFDAFSSLLAEKNLKTACLTEKTDIDSLEQWGNIFNTIPLFLKKAFLRLLTFLKTLFSTKIQRLPLGFTPVSGLLRAPPF